MNNSSPLRHTMWIVLPTIAVLSCYIGTIHHFIYLDPGGGPVIRAGTGDLGAYWRLPTGQRSAHVTLARSTASFRWWFSITPSSVFVPGWVFVILAAIPGAIAVIAARRCFRKRARG